MTDTGRSHRASIRAADLPNLYSAVRALTMRTPVATLVVDCFGDDSEAANALRWQRLSAIVTGAFPELRRLLKHDHDTLRKRPAFRRADRAWKQVQLEGRDALAELGALEPALLFVFMRELARLTGSTPSAGRSY